MPNLTKALLQRISNPRDRRTSPEIIESTAVQFNPTSLKLKITNDVEGGRSAGRQRRQSSGTSSAVLTLELHYDTADEGTADEPVSVRDKTRFVEEFVRPMEGHNQPPPRVRFHWGNLVFDGIVENVDVDLEHFAASGVPLRAKCSLSIKEQNPQYQFEKPSEAEGEGGSAPDAGTDSSGAAGTTGDGEGDRSAPALAGESPADFASRMGLDPSAWRALSGIAGAGLELAGGAEIGFSADLSASVGVGVNVGVEVGADLSIEAAFGLEASASASAGASAAAGGSVDAERAQGFALSAAGGLGAAIESVQGAKADAAVEGARSGFETPAGSTAAASTTNAGADVKAPSVEQRKPGPPTQDRKPLRAGDGAASGSTAVAAQPAPTPPRVDPRARTYGFGVPLKARRGPAAEERAGFVVLTARAGETALQPSRDPAEPSWVRLPRHAVGREIATGGGRGPKPCGCRRACKHPGGGA